MWNPFDPVVFTQLGSPSSSSRSRSASAAARSTRGSSFSVGSRSNTQMSGWFSFGAREIHTCGVIVFWFTIHKRDRVSVTIGW